jgi:3-hydroxyisobutyrate dehydrogenase-like beta-hydroxyacid dehydrogenase
VASSGGPRGLAGGRDNARVTTVAVIGLGAMGSRIARRILDAGHDVVVWNRTASKMRPLTDLGARPASTPAEAAAGAEAVITVVADPAALRDVIEGPEGVAAGAGPSTTVIQMSTVGLASVGQVADALPAGTGLLDSPVLGSVSEAESGSLAVFVGGPPELFERWSPLLAALGTPMHVGPHGAGTVAKLVANSTLFGVLGVLGEALSLAGKLGLSSEVTFEVLARTPLAAQADRRRSAVESGEYPLRFRLSLAAKDAGLILDAARSGAAELRLAEAMRRWFVDADEAGLGDQDYSVVLARIMASGGRWIAAQKGSDSMS